MPFSISNKPSPSEISDAVNYLLANFSQVQAVNPNSGQITTSSFGVVGYLYKYLNVKYADSFDGSVNFSDSPTNRLYYGLRNNDSSVESTLYSDYVWTPVTGGFGTTKFFFYATSGGRQIQTTVATTAPASGWAVDTGAIIDLDIVTFVLASVTSFSAGTTGFTPNTPTQGAVVLAGTLGVANGGTNGSATPTAGAVAYGTGTAYGFTASGTAGQVLTSAGAGVPTWATNASGDVSGPASSTDNAVARFDGTTGKIIQNSVTTIDDTGNASGILSQQFSNGSAVTLAAGKFWYDGSTGAWNLGMGNGNITQQVGEEIFIYGKASAAITDSPLQIIYHTGTVGASGVITFAPTIAGITDVNAIIGIATESLALNGFGRATVFGVVRGITTNGTAFGETWADDDVIWYNPVTGNPTKVEPVAPYIKVQVGLVIKAGPGGSGSFQVGIARGSKLGGTDSNVQIGTPSNGQILTYDGAATYWKNTTLTAGTGVSITTSAGGVLTVSATGSGGTVTSVTGTSPVSVANGTTTPVISLASGYGDTQNPYASKTANYVLAAPNGSAGVPTFRALVAADVPGSALTKTDDTNVTLTLGGSATTALLNAASLTLGWTGQLGISRGGTNTSTAPSAYGVVYGNSGGTAYTSLANGTTGQVLTATTSGAPTWANPATSGTVTSVSVVSANGFAGTVATATSTPAITISTSITGILKGNGTAISAAVANTDYVPLSTVITKTADYTITGTDTWIINNKPTTALTLTFPAASSWTGRSITVKNMQALAVISASSNIVPLDSTTAGTAILLGVVGNWATLVSDGTNWVIMQAATNNNLLLE
jgi:hypothetical protein